MVQPSSCLNFPLAVLAIFLRKVIDKFRRIPKNALIRKSLLLNFHMLSHQQWSYILTALAVTCTVAKIWYSGTGTVLFSLAKNKAGVLNTNLRRRQWLSRRKSWVNEFHSRKNKEAPLKLGVSNMVAQIKNKSYQESQTERSSYQESSLDVFPYSPAPLNLKSCLKATDKSTYIGPSASTNKFSQTEDDLGQRQIKKSKDVRKSLSEVSLISNNNSLCSSTEREMQQQNNPELWQATSFVQNYDCLEKQLQQLSMMDQERNKYMDPICDMLPIGVHFNEFINEDGNKSEEERHDFIQPKPLPRKRRRKKLIFTIKKKGSKGMRLYGTTSDNHLIRQTRSGKVYGYSNALKK